MSPAWMKALINLWPPYIGAGVRVEHISPDYRRVQVALKLRWYNRNAVGTHFGGSLFAMTDPFYMLMLMKILGRDYIVWDKAASIDFVAPGRGKVTALFELDEQQVAAIVNATANGDKCLPELAVRVVDEQGQTVATIRKTLYIRRKQPKHNA